MRRESGQGFERKRIWVTLLVSCWAAYASHGAFPSAASALPNSRGYELVSPVAKNGADVTLGGGSFRAAAQGGAVLFDSNVASGDARATGVVGVVTFRADRGTTSWSTRTLFPHQAENPDAATNGAVLDWVAPDLAHGLLRAGDPALVPGAPSGVANLYLTDGSGGLPMLLTSSVNPVVPGAFYAPLAVDGSHDVKQIAFESTQNLTADAPPQDPFFCGELGFCFPRLYQWDDGTLRLAGILPDGSPAPFGALAGFGVSFFNADSDRALADDGRRLYFTTPPFGFGAFFGPTQLYLRKDSETTVLASASEASSPEGSPGDARFWSASADGTSAFFTTAEHLLDADTNGVDDLYMYTDSASPDTDSNLTLISEDNESSDGSDPQFAGMLGVSADGSHVYFVAERQIVAGETTAFGPKLYVWHDGSVRFITLLDSSFADSGNWHQSATARTSRISPGGRYLVFTTAASQGEFDTGGHQQVFRYDRMSEQIACVSCLTQDGQAASASINFPGATTTVEYPQYSSRALSADGRQVFFNTAASLVQEDVNGKVDAYVWDEGSIRLISTGQSERDAYFVDASANGDEAYFVTHERLVGWDIDTRRDLYVAKVGGGLPEPPVARVPCTGETCQGTLDDSPAATAPGSSALSESEDVVEMRRASFSVGRLRVGARTRWAKTGTVVLRVRVSEEGTVRARVRWRHHGKSNIAAAATRIADGARTLRLRLALSEAARRELAHAGRLRLTLLVSYSRARAAKRIPVLLLRGARVTGAETGGSR